jgi:long-chain acyl-CoA synthetase
MKWSKSIIDCIAEETHFDGNKLRCFTWRPANLNAMFAEALTRNGDGEAVVCDNTRLIYKQLDQEVAVLAAGLHAKGIGQGDRVVMLIGNRIEFLTVLLATLRLGAIAVPINIHEQTPELAYILNHCGAVLLIHDRDLNGKIPQADGLVHLKHRYSIVGATQASQNFTALTEIAKTISVPSSINEEDVAVILYTSGTTGRPKGAMLTHFNIIHSAMHFELCMELGHGERSLLAVPASHVTGLVAILFTMLRVAGCTVMMGTFEAQAFLEAAAKERVTQTLIVPAMYNLFLMRCEIANHDLAAWSIGGYGGAPMPQSTIEALSQKLPNLILVNAYGSTEASSPATMILPGTGRTLADSVGIALPCADIRVVDENGKDLPVDEHGELWIAGPMVVPDYWDNEEKTQAEFKNGYWKSGDVGSRDAQGFFRLHDCKKGMIIRGGYNIYSAEIENVITAHEAVVECAAFGRPDEVLGEKMEVFVHTGDMAMSAEDIKAHCAARLADYNIPDFVNFTATTLPRNANVKIVKKELRKRTLQRFGKD